jgi:hypothetical protein
MRGAWLLAIAVNVGFLGSGCGSKPGVEVGVDRDTLNAVEDLKKAMQESLLTLSDAIPGGRYTRLVEDLHGGDPTKKEAAQQFLRSLAGLDPAVQYYASVWFEFDPAKPLHALIFRASLPSADEILTRYKQANIVNATAVSSTPLGGPGPGQVQQDIQNALAAAVAGIAGLPPSASEGWSPGQPCSPLSNGLNLSCEQLQRLYDQANRERSEAQARAVGQFMSAFDAFYRQWPLPLSANIKTLPWPPFDERQSLFVLIPESDWKAHDGNIKVFALLHEKDKPQVPLPGADRVVFEKDEWKPIKLRDSQQPPRDFRWAVHTMSDTLLISSETAERVQAVRDALAKWEKVHLSSKP